MKLLSERNQVREVARRFRAQYPAGTYGGDRRKRNVAAELEALDTETATAEQVAEIIGNSSWVGASTCHECGVDTWDAVQLGQEPDYESSTANICKSCLEKALSLFK